MLVKTDIFMFGIHQLEEVSRILQLCL